MEEAANIAAEYIASLDNLAQEVKFLLEEIRYKDSRQQELQESINKESSRYLRHSLRSANPSSAPTPNSSGVGSSSGPFTAKDEQIPDRVQHDYDELEKLANEKIKLTEKLNSLIARTRARLDHDLKKVLILQGDLDPNHPPPTLSAAPTLAAGLNSVAGLGGSHSGTGMGAVSSSAGGISHGVGGVGLGVGGGAGGYAGVGHGSMRNPVQMMNESLRNAMAGADVLPVPVQQQHQQQVASAMSGASATNKRIRKTASTVMIPSIKLPSPAPATINVPQRHVPSVPSATAHRPSPGRPSRQQQHQPPKLPTPVPMAIDGGDEDAEGEDDLEGVDEADVDDDRIYCVCHRTSFGEMVACDNPNCPYEWFHLPCVNLKPPLPESWYCNECVNKGFAPADATPVGSGAGLNPTLSVSGGSERSRKRKR